LWIRVEALSRELSIPYNTKIPEHKKYIYKTSVG
jgi:hypothetical protein